MPFLDSQTSAFPLMKTLHVLNGDGLLDCLTHSGLPGDHLAWREALSRGPVHPDVGSPEFWELRAAHIHSSYPESKDYSDWVIPEFERLQDFSAYSSYVLWFGQDYFCQVNLIALLSWLHTHAPADFPIALVCVDQFPGLGPITCLGSLSPEQLASLFPKRVFLTGEELEIAHGVWLAYCAESPLPFNQLATMAPVQGLPFLPQMIERHRRLFPDPQDGLNELERNILVQVGAEPSSQHKLIGHLLRTDTAYGFGDLQVIQFLQDLEGLLVGDPPRLNSKGEAILAQKDRFQPPTSTPIQNGGASRADYSWTGKELILAKN